MYRLFVSTDLGGVIKKAFWRAENAFFANRTNSISMVHTKHF
jgi:hypothetical protein